MTTESTKPQGTEVEWNDPWNKDMHVQSWEDVEARQAYNRSIETRWGVEVPRPVQVYSTADKDSLRNLSYSMANFNPLYFDQEYAAKTPHGRVVAPPNFVVLVANPNAGQAGLGAVGGGSGAMGQPLHGGVDYEFYRSMYIGDTFRFTATPESVVLKRGRKMGQAYMRTGNLKFYNQHNALVCKVTCWDFASVGDSMKQGRGFRPYHAYTDDDLRAIDKIHSNEPNTIRGSNPRWWEDVQVGEELPTFARGPLQAQDWFAWCVAGGVPGSNRAYVHEVGSVEPEDLKNYLGKPLPPPKKITMAAAMRKSRGGAARLDAGGLAHIIASPRDVGGWGVPSEYAQLRAAIGMISLTHWMGDTGFLKRMRLEYRHVHQIGDTVYLKGRVTSKEIKDGEHLVHFDYWSENQLGEITAPGLATVRLPSRGR